MSDGTEEKKEDGADDKRKLHSSLEAQIFNGALDEIDDSLRSALLMMAVRELFANKKVQLKNNLDHWAETTFQNKLNQIDFTYEHLPADELKRAFDKDRYKELFGIALSEIQMEWKKLLGLDKNTIIHNIN